MASSTDSPPAAVAAPNGHHLLTVVLEDYFQVAPLKSVVQSGQWYRFETRVERNTVMALDVLDEFGIRAPFFVLGWIADELAGGVREVVTRGHEIASKGYYHRSVRQLGRGEFRDDAVRSREALERASCSRVLGYRIAQGWFGPRDLWALDVLAEEGFAYDSSIRPQFRAFAHEPWRRFVHQHRCGEATLWEFPLSTWSLAGWSLPIAGGNYLRQFPHALMWRAVAHWDRTCDAPFVMYFHVWELDPEQPRIRAAPLRERLRQYRNLEKMEGIIRHYLGHYRFQAIGDYLGLDERSDDAPSGDAAPSPPAPARTSGDRREIPAGEVPMPPGSADQDRPMPVTVVIPCFNEELVLPYLANTLRSVEATLEPEYELSFVLVDDGSFDGTWASLHKIFGSMPNCTLVRHPENRGVAAAILTGIQRSRAEIVCSIDCDCTYDPHQLRSLIPMLEDGVDMVTGSPYHPQGQVRNVPSWRLSLSRGLSFLYRLVLRQSLATYTSCFRVYRRDAVVDLPIREGGFLGVAEMLGLLDLRGARIVESPAVLEVRLLGRSKLKILRTAAGHLRLLARLAVARWGPNRNRSDNGRKPKRKLDSP